MIGDYDGDGKDDIGTWLGKTTRQVYVALSTGTSFDTPVVWHTFFAVSTYERPRVARHRLRAGRRKGVRVPGEVGT